MIYTVTFNPAIDYVMFLDGIKTGCVNRSSSENIFFGGKGINVSMVLRELGVESTALGFTAGFTGKAIEDAVRENGIASDFVRLKSGCSRINVKIKSGEETEINSQGPAIDDEALAELFKKTDKLAERDTIILAGSIPSSLPSDIYERICARLDGRGVRVIVDASGELLRNVLRYHPFLIKPNNFELGELFGAEIDTAESAAEYAAKLQEIALQIDWTPGKYQQQIEPLQKELQKSMKYFRKDIDRCTKFKFRSLIARFTLKLKSFFLFLRSAFFRS